MPNDFAAAVRLRLEGLYAEAYSKVVHGPAKCNTIQRPAYMMPGYGEPPEVGLPKAMTGLRDTILCGLLPPSLSRLQKSYRPLSNS